MSGVSREGFSEEGEFKMDLGKWLVAKAPK